MVIRDYAGVIAERPVRIFDNSGDAARLVAGPGGDLGGSLFAGFVTPFGKQGCQLKLRDWNFPLTTR